MPTPLPQLSEPRTVEQPRLRLQSRGDGLRLRDHDEPSFNDTLRAATDARNEQRTRSTSESRHDTEQSGDRRDTDRVSGDDQVEDSDVVTDGVASASPDAVETDDQQAATTNNGTDQESATTTDEHDQQQADAPVVRAAEDAPVAQNVSTDSATAARVLETIAVTNASATTSRARPQQETNISGRVPTSRSEGNVQLDAGVNTTSATPVTTDIASTGAAAVSSDAAATAALAAELQAVASESAATTNVTTSAAATTARPAANAAGTALNAANSGERNADTAPAASVNTLSAQAPTQAKTSDGAADRQDRRGSRRTNAASATSNTSASQNAASARAEQVEQAVRLENVTGAPVVRDQDAKPTLGRVQVNADQQTQQAQARETENNLANQRTTERVIRGLSAMVNQRGGSLTMRLDPPELGQLRIQMTINQGTVSAQFTPATEQAQALLERGMASLRSALEDQGLNVERLTVQSAGPGNQAGAGDNNGDARDGGQGRHQGERDDDPQQQYRGSEHGGSRRDHPTDFASVLDGGVTTETEGEQP